MTALAVLGVPDFTGDHLGPDGTMVVGDLAPLTPLHIGRASPAPSHYAAEVLNEIRLRLERGRGGSC